MSNETKEEIKAAIDRQRARFDDEELVLMNKIRFLIDKFPTPQSRSRAVQYLFDRYKIQGASAGSTPARGVGAVIPDVFE